jgi:hypothetical protein
LCIRAVPSYEFFQSSFQLDCQERWSAIGEGDRRAGLLVFARQPNKAISSSSEVIAEPAARLIHSLT